MIFYLKILAFLPGIGILAGMFAKSFGFYSLATCVAAAVSKSKKTVSAAAAAVVGIGLLTVPMEQAQANHGDIPLVLSVDIDCYSSPPRFSFSLTHDWPNGHCGSVSHPGTCFYEGGYTVLKLNRFIRWLPNGDPDCSTSEWIEIWVWMGDDNSQPSAYIYDSEGNFYYVDLYIDGYWISGPSF